MTQQHCPSCGGFLAVRTSHTAKNPNRKFVTCHNVKDGRECNYFKWLEGAQLLVSVPPKRSEWLEEIDESPASLGAPQSSVEFNPNQSTDQVEGGSPSGAGQSEQERERGAIIRENKTKPLSDSTANESVPDTSGIVSGLAFLSKSNHTEPKEATKPSHTWSKYQESIFDNFETGSGNLRIEAVAGAGKTSTTAEGSKRLSKNLSIKFMVFSKANQLDMADKVPSNVEATTAHASGYADIRRKYHDIKLDERKVYQLLDKRYEWNQDVKQVGSEIAKLISLCQNTLLEPTAANLDYLCDRFQVIVNGQIDTIYDATAKLYGDMLAETSILNFDEMVYWPASGKVSVSQSDVLIVDEAQDTNAAQQAFYLQAVKSNGRLIFVGDARQAIFGFRGSDTDAMDNLSKALNPSTLPLSICYRCGRAMVELAKTIVPQIEAWEHAPAGKVTNLSESQFSKSVQYGDMVLCRLNAPLVKPAFDLIRQGKKATIRGRDIGKGLTTLLRKIQKRSHAESLHATIFALTNYVQQECSKLLMAHKENQADTLQDQFDTLLALSDGCYSVSDLERRIGQVFSDEAGDGVVFSSWHRAKGLEADRVFILKPDLLPYPKAKTDWQIEQEMNLKYVALTRARKELVFVR